MYMNTINIPYMKSVKSKKLLCVLKIRKLLSKEQVDMV